MEKSQEWLEMAKHYLMMMYTAKFESNVNEAKSKLVEMGAIHRSGTIKEEHTELIRYYVEKLS